MRSMCGWRKPLLLALVWGALLATNAAAQQASGIAGVVRDSGGLPIPGVTVEAASPVLIEKTRTVVSDGIAAFTIADDRIVAIDLVVDPEKLPRI